MLQLGLEKVRMKEAKASCTPCMASGWSKHCRRGQGTEGARSARSCITLRQHCLLLLVVGASAHLHCCAQ